MMVPQKVNPQENSSQETYENHNMAYQYSKGKFLEMQSLSLRFDDPGTQAGTQLSSE